MAAAALRKPASSATALAPTSLLLNPYHWQLLLAVFVDLFGVSPRRGFGILPLLVLSRVIVGLTMTLSTAIAAVHTPDADRAAAVAHVYVPSVVSLLRFERHRCCIRKRNNIRGI